MSIIKKSLKKHSYLKLVLIDVSNINKIEKDYGKMVYEDILGNLRDIILNMHGKQIRTNDIITVNYHQGDMFYLFLAQGREGKPFQAGTVENIADRIYSHINKEIFNTIFPLMKKRPNVNVGYAIKIYNPLIREERLIEQLIEDARLMIKYKEFSRITVNQEKLQELILKEEIKTIYQPIVDMSTMTALGYEALSRGPQGTVYENPYSLFNIAEEVGLLLELDNLCRRKAFSNAKGLEKGRLLFVNIFPASIHDPEFRGKFLKDFLKDLRIAPRSVVLEVNEQQIIENYQAFREASRYYSGLGFAIAIDDTGAGYSNLKSIVELELQFLKIDISLIRGIDKSKLKQNVVNSLLLISNDMGAKVIAEGIETKEEFATLKDMGIHYGQGFLIARPAPPFTGINIIEV
jgi:EAL domain-containing protein (putative c-di-GMP-specific phosphodiesterase class I)